MLEQYLILCGPHFFVDHILEQHRINFMKTFRAFINIDSKPAELQMTIIGVTIH